MSGVIAPVVTRERDGAVARVVIGPGVRRNALTSGAWEGIERAMRAIAGDEAVRVVVLEGAAGWFSAGSDIREWAQATPEQVELSFARMEGACVAVEELPVPVIAKIRGPAAGAGCQLAMACDLRILGEGAAIGMPIARLGILVSASFANRLAANTSAAVAADLLYTGRMVSAAEAVLVGLANACVPVDELDQTVETAVDNIVRVSGAAVRATKTALSQLAGPARAAAAARTGPPVDYADFHHGVNAFVHRRRRRTLRVAP